MLKVATYTIKGTKVGETTLPKDMFEVKPNLNLLAQAIHVYRERSHTGLRKTQTRSEVNRTTKKLYKQKGTGGARHGSRRAPIFVGGGVALGPRPIRRIVTLSQTLKNKAKAHAFSQKAKEGEIVAVSGISKVVKTGEVGDFLKKLAKETKAKRFMFVLSDGANATRRFLKNLAGVKSVSYREITAFDIWDNGILVLDKDIFAAKTKK